MEAQAQRHRDDHHKPHRSLFPCRRQDNRQEHPVDRDAQRRPHKLRQQRSRRASQQRPQRPPDPRRDHQPVQVHFPDLPRLRARHREDLIRVRESKDHPLQRPHAPVQFPAQRQAHQRVPQVDRQLRQRHFRQRSPADHQRQRRDLPGACQVGHRDQHRLQHRQPVARGLHAEGKTHAQVSQRDGDPVPDPLPKFCAHRFPFTLLQRTFFESRSSSQSR